MIALIALLALCFAWACIATAVAIVNDRLSKAYKELSDRRAVQIEALQDRQQAANLSEYHAARRVAMEPFPEVPKVDYLYDDTGLIRGTAEPIEADAE